MECFTAITNGVGKYSSGMGKDGLQKMVLGKPDNHMEKNETESLPYTIHKNKLKMD